MQVLRTQQLNPIQRNGFFDRRFHDQREIRQEPGSLKSGLLQYAYYVFGFFFVGLAVLGAALPVLPTTPFLILASGCFMRSSPEMQAWLMRLPVWGPILQNWETHHAIGRRTKAIALIMLIIIFATTIILGRFSPAMQTVFFTLVTAGLITLWRLPVLNSDTISVDPVPQPPSDTGLLSRRSHPRK